jgi:hypothetical protein
MDTKYLNHQKTTLMNIKSINCFQRYFFNFVTTIGLMLAVISVVKAQDLPPVQGEIEDAQVIIEKDRKIILPFQQRYYDKISEVAQSTVTEKLSYSYLNTFYAPPSVNQRYQAAELSKAKQLDLQQSEIRVGFGNYQSPIGKASIFTNLSDNFLAGLDVRHLSFGVGEIDDKNSASSQTVVGLKGDYFTENSTAFGRVNYSSNTGYFYGYSPQSEVDRSTIKQQFNEFNFSTGYELLPTEDSPLNLKLSGEANLLSSALTLAENAFAINANIGYQANENIRAEISARGLLSSLVTDSVDVNRNLYKIRPSFTYAIDKLSVTAGANVVLVDDTTYVGKSTGIFPHFSINYAFSDAANMYLGVSGDVNEVLLKNLSAENFFISNNAYLSHSNQNYKFNLGVRGGINNFSYHVNGSFEQVENMAFFANGLADSTRFDLVYELGNTSILQTNLQLGYNVSNRFRANVDITYFSYTLDSLEQAWHMPKYQARLGGTIKANEKLSFMVNYLLLGGIEALNLQSGTKRSLGIISDIALQADYKINKNWGAFISVDNLLNSNYERYANYINRGIMLKVGASLSF